MPYRLALVVAQMNVDRIQPGLELFDGARSDQGRGDRGEPKLAKVRPEVTSINLRPRSCLGIYLDSIIGTSVTSVSLPIAAHASVLANVVGVV